jgi:hypothetical protein
MAPPLQTPQATLRARSIAQATGTFSWDKALPEKPASQVFLK